ncbi:hypothetical protein SO802_024194, partial [Lithocarpus litseifolius]
MQGNDLCMNALWWVSHLSSMQYFYTSGVNLGRGTKICFRVEINIKPWKHLLNDPKEGNKRMGWMARESYAYWKGNPSVALIKQELMKCNVSDNQDWNACVYAQLTEATAISKRHKEWGRELVNSFKKMMFRESKKSEQATQIYRKGDMTKKHSAES